MRLSKSHPKGGETMEEYTIKHVMEHVEVYRDGEFLFSADNEKEALTDLKQYYIT